MNQFEPFYFTGSDLYSSELDRKALPICIISKNQKRCWILDWKEDMKGIGFTHLLIRINISSILMNWLILLMVRVYSDPWCLATLHIDNRTDLSIFPAFFNECKIRDNNVDNMLMVGISIIYTVNICMLFDWLVNFPPILGCHYWFYSFICSRMALFLPLSCYSYFFPESVHSRTWSEWQSTLRTSSVETSQLCNFDLLVDISGWNSLHSTPLLGASCVSSCVD